jgi:hypothetical protein
MTITKIRRDFLLCNQPSDRSKMKPPAQETEDMTMGCLAKAVARLRAVKDEKGGLVEY